MNLPTFKPQVVTRFAPRTRMTSSHAALGRNRTSVQSNGSQCACTQLMMTLIMVKMTCDTLEIWTLLDLYPALQRGFFEKRSLARDHCTLTATSAGDGPGLYKIVCREGNSCLGIKRMSSRVSSLQTQPCLCDSTYQNYYIMELIFSYASLRPVNPVFMKKIMYARRSCVFVVAADECCM